MICKHCGDEFNPITKKINYCVNCFKTLNAIEKDDIKRMVKVVDVLEHFHVQKSENGNNYCCVNHSEKNASMDIRKNFAHCYVCGFNGDAIQAYRAINGCDMASALLEMNELFCNNAFGATNVDKQKLRERIIKADLKKRKQEEYNEKDLKVYSILCDKVRKLTAESDKYKCIKWDITEHENIIAHYCNINSKISKYNDWLDAYFYDNASWKNFVNKVKVR